MAFASADIGTLKNIKVFAGFDLLQNTTAVRTLQYNITQKLIDFAEGISIDLAEKLTLPAVVVV